MTKPKIEPIIINGGSAFCGNTIISTRPLARLPNLAIDKVRVVSLGDWCRYNFITKRVGRTLIKRKLLIGFRFGGQWWVTSNPSCIDELLEYLGVEKLLFDADNN